MGGAAEWARPCDGVVERARPVKFARGAQEGPCGELVRVVPSLFFYDPQRWRCVRRERGPVKFSKAKGIEDRNKENRCKKV